MPEYRLMITPRGGAALSQDHMLPDDHAAIAVAASLARAAGASAAVWRCDDDTEVLLGSWLIGAGEPVWRAGADGPDSAA